MTRRRTAVTLRLQKAAHHNLFFDVDFDAHAAAIYDIPKWPEQPLFYANFPSVSDTSMAPKGKEACFLLLPLAPGLEDTPAWREKYFHIMMDRMEHLLGQPLKEKVLFQESFCVKDFVRAYNSYKGNAYGMANTLMQTAFLRPKLISKKMLSQMRQGSVIVDVAIDQGGFCETSKATTHENPTYVVDGVTHYCVANMPGAVPKTSSVALNNATLPFALALANKGYKQALIDDKHLRNGLNVYRGQVTHKAVAEALDLQYVSTEEVLKS